MSDPRTTPTRSDAVGTIEGRAIVYALLSHVWRDPDESLVTVLRGHDDLAGWPHAMDEFSSEVNAQIRKLHDLCRQLRGRPGPLIFEELQSSYARLFGHSVRGTCPAYELEYGRSEIIQQTAELADLTGFYHAFGMSINESAFERADHVAVECEFLAVLCAKEAWGRRQNHGQLAETCSDAQRLFLRDHVARWLPAFAHRVMIAEPEGFYHGCAALAASFIADECRRFDIEAGPQWLELRPADPEADSSIDCDTAACGAASTDSLVQIGIEGRSNGGAGE